MLMEVVLFLVRPAPGVDASRDPPQRVARRDLRQANAVRVASCAGLPVGLRDGPLGLEVHEPRDVDRLERQRALETLVGRRVERTSSLERALPIQVEPVALEAQRAAAPVVNATYFSRGA